MYIKKYLYNGLAAAFSIVAFIGFFLAATSMVTKATVKDIVITESFIALLKTKNVLAFFAFAFAVSTFVLAIVLLLLSVIKMFTINKYLKSASFIISIITIALALTTIVFVFASCLQRAQQMAIMSTTFLPGIGTYLLALGAIGAGVTLIIEKYMKKA